MKMNFISQGLIFISVCLLTVDNFHRQQPNTETVYVRCLLNIHPQLSAPNTDAQNFIEEMYTNNFVPINGLQTTTNSIAVRQVCHASQEINILLVFFLTPSYFILFSKFFLENSFFYKFRLYN